MVGLLGQRRAESVVNTTYDNNPRPTLRVQDLIIYTLDETQYLVLSLPGKLSETKNEPCPKTLSPSSAQ